MRHMFPFLMFNPSLKYSAMAVFCMLCFSCYTERKWCMAHLEESAVAGWCDPFLLAMAGRAYTNPNIGPAFGDLIVAQCAQYLLREQQCQSKSSIKPVIDLSD